MDQIKQKMCGIIHKFKSLLEEKGVMEKIKADLDRSIHETIFGPNTFIASHNEGLFLLLFNCVWSCFVFGIKNEYNTRPWTIACYF